MPYIIIRALFKLLTIIKSSLFRICFEVNIKFNNNNNNNNKFNLPFNLVPLMGLRRQILIGKTSLFIEKKPIF